MAGSSASLPSGNQLAWWSRKMRGTYQVPVWEPAPQSEACWPAAPGQPVSRGYGFAGCSHCGEAGLGARAWPGGWRARSPAGGPGACAPPRFASAAQRCAATPSVAKPRPRPGCFASCKSLRQNDRGRRARWPPAPVGSGGLRWARLCSMPCSSWSRSAGLRAPRSTTAPSRAKASVVLASSGWRRAMPIAISPPIGARCARRASKGFARSGGRWSSPSGCCGTPAQGAA